MICVVAYLIYAAIFGLICGERYCAAAHCTLCKAVSGAFSAQCKDTPIDFHVHAQCAPALLSYSSHHLLLTPLPPPLPTLPMYRPGCAFPV